MSLPPIRSPQFLKTALRVTEPDGTLVDEIVTTTPDLKEPVLVDQDPRTGRKVELVPFDSAIER